MILHLIDLLLLVWLTYRTASSEDEPSRSRVLGDQVPSLP